MPEPAHSNGNRQHSPTEIVCLNCDTPNRLPRDRRDMVRAVAGGLRLKFECLYCGEIEYLRLFNWQHHRRQPRTQPESGRSQNDNHDYPRLASPS